MRWTYKVPLRFRSLFRKSCVEKDLSDELRFHLEKLSEDYIAQGMTSEEARYAAQRDLGGVEQVKEECRDMRRVNYIEKLSARCSPWPADAQEESRLRSYRDLDSGAGDRRDNTIFSVVDTVMLKPLPFPTADRLVRIRSVFASTGVGSGVASYPDFLDWRARDHVFEGMAAFRTGDFTLIGAREPRHLQGAVVSAQLFSLLGVTPALGRGFLPEEDHPAAASGADPVILSYGLWQRDFSSDASVLGRTLQLGDQPFTVVGVMPQGFQYPIQAEPIELWTTIAVDARGSVNAMTTQRGAHYLDVAGLLKPVVTLRRRKPRWR